MKKSQIIIAFFIVFFSGLLVGVFCDKYYNYAFRGDMPPPPPRNFRAMMDKKIAQRLNLTVEQQAAIKPAFEKWSASFIEINKTHAPQVKAVFFALYDDIEKNLVLNAEQKAELAKMRQMTLDRLTMQGKFNIPGEPPPPPPEPGPHDRNDKNHKGH